MGCGAGATGTGSLAGGIGSTVGVGEVVESGATTGSVATASPGSSGMETACTAAAPSPKPPTRITKPTTIEPIRVIPLSCQYPRRKSIGEHLPGPNPCYPLTRKIPDAPRSASDMTWVTKR